MRFNNTDNRVKKAISKLYRDRTNQYEKKYIRNKKIAFWTILLLFACIAVIYSVCTNRESVLVGEKNIVRNDPEGTDKHVSLRAKSSGGYSKNVRITVKSRQYTEEELNSLFASFKEELLKNTTSEETMVNHIEGYPFSVKWDEQETDGEIKVFKASVSYEDFVREIMIPIQSAQEKLTEESFWELVNTEIERLSKDTREIGYQILPSEVEGQQIIYEEKADLTWLFILAIGLIAAMLYDAGRDEEILKKAEERDEQVRKEYPQVVNRIALYYGAGLSVKNVWMKICEDYEKKQKAQRFKKKIVYEEMLRCKKYMNDGMGEEDAYERFAQNIGLAEYTALVGILQQAVKTGGSDYANLLKERRRAAYEDQKKRARILGEKAGTKLLLPMFMMLSVVLIIILIPAFMTF